MSLSYRAVMTYTNDFDRFVKAVNSIQKLWPNLTIIDNSINKCVQKKYPNINVFETPVQITCSQCFNAAQNIARKYNSDILIMMHSDMEVTDEKKLLEFMNYLEDLQKDKSKNWGVVFTHYDALCAFNIDCMDVIGPWDNNITHYPIDVDYYYRIKKYGFECLDYGGDWVEHHASSTVRKNIMMEYINYIHTNQCNNSYYHKKWGGARDQEQFSFPFKGGDLNSVYLKIIGNPLYNKLLSSSKSTEGGFLCGHDNELTRFSQFSLLLNILNATKPKRILEIGTHKYLFTYFLSYFIEHFKIDTFDCNEECIKSWDIINDALPNIDIHFHIGDSKESVKNLLNPREDKFDFAWVDGGHDYETVLSDLNNCARLKIPYILSDDSKLEPINNAIVEFFRTNKNYYEVKNPYWDYDGRGIVVIRRKR